MSETRRRRGTRVPALYPDHPDRMPPEFFPKFGAMRLCINGAAGNSSAVFYLGRFRFKKLFSLRYFNNFYSVTGDVNTSERGIFRAVRGV